MLDRLPPELVALIASGLAAQRQNRTLAALAQACQAVHAACIPVLYRRLVLTRGNADALFRGLPRTAYAFVCPPYAEYAAELAAFQAEHAEERAADDEFEMHPEFDWDELPHPADGQYCEEHEVAASNAVSWARRRELLRFCTELVVVQWPRIGVVCDLIKAADPTFEYSPTKDGSEDERQDEDEEEESQDQDTDADEGEAEDNGDDAASDKPSPDVCAGTESLFPNLLRLCISSEAVRTMADYEESHTNQLNADAYDYGDHDDRYIPYRRLLGSALGPAKHVCMSRPPSPYDDADDGATKAKYIFDMYRRPVASIYDGHFEYTLGGREERVAQMSASMPPSLCSLTVHGLMGRDSIEIEGQSAPKYRLFYDPAGTAADTVENRARALLASAKSVHSVVEVGPLEVIGVECGIRDGPQPAAEAIRTRVEDAIAADPEQFGERIPPPTFLPAQHAPEAAAALAALEAELAALGPDLPTKGTYSANALLAQAQQRVETERGTAREDAALAEVAAAEADVAQAAKAKAAKEVKDGVRRKIAGARQELRSLREDYEQWSYKLHLPRVVWRTAAEAEPCVVCGTRAGPGDAEW